MININKNILSKLDDTELLFSNLKCFYNNSDLKKEILFRCLHNLLEQDPVKALNIINLIRNKFDDVSYLALRIKILSQNLLISEAIDILNKIPMHKIKKRFCMPIYHSLCKFDKSNAFLFLLSYIHKKFRIYEYELQSLYSFINKSNFNKLIEIMTDNDIVISDIEKFKNINCFKFNISALDGNNCCSFCKNKLTKLPFSNENRQKLVSNLEAEYLKGNIIKMNEFFKKIKLNNYDTFIDGNNVLFYIDRKITINSFHRLEFLFNELIKKNKSPLIFLHRRHLDYLKKNLKKYNYINAKNILERLGKYIYYTPYKMNDDWFFIWAGLNINNSYLVTNDLLRDHINTISEEDAISNTLSRWIEEYVIKYDFTKNNVSLLFPKDVSMKIQYNNGSLHIPINNGKWICYC